MSSNLAYNTHTHVVDILGNVAGRDQPIMLMSKAIGLVNTLSSDVFLDDDVVFFDPFCKAGEILLACAFSSCRVQFELVPELFTMEAFKKQVKKELYFSNRYFALAPDERHHRLSLRTFLGNENSHKEHFNHIIRNGNYVSEVDGKLNRDKFEQEFLSMLEHIKSTSGKKKIIAVGNPPYQETDGGFRSSAKAIYPYFSEILMDSEELSEFVLVIPSRWFSAGKGVESFRKKIIDSSEIKAINYFKNAKEVFPTVDVMGGVCFIHYQKNFNNKAAFIEKGVNSNVDFSNFDIILDDPKGYSLIDKIKGVWNGQFVSEVAQARKPFGLATDYFKKNKKCSLEDVNSLPCYSKGRKILYANKNDITKNIEIIDKWKVAIPSAYAPGSKVGVRRVTLPVKQYFIIPKDHITTETYSIVGSFQSKDHAENFQSYLQTDFARYLLGLRKITQHIPRDRWNWVPYMDVSRQWTDKDLFDYFNITPEEQQHIKNKVKEWS